jgi:hypothetical protein
MNETPAQFFQSADRTIGAQMDRVLPAGGDRPIVRIGEGDSPRALPPVGDFVHVERVTDVGIAARRAVGQLPHAVRNDVFKEKRHVVPLSGRHGYTDDLARIASDLVLRGREAVVVADQVLFLVDGRLVIGDGEPQFQHGRGLEHPRDFRLVLEIRPLDENRPGHEKHDRENEERVRQPGAPHGARLRTGLRGLLVENAIDDGVGQSVFFTADVLNVDMRKFSQQALHALVQGLQVGVLHAVLP